MSPCNRSPRWHRTPLLGPRREGHFDGMRRFALLLGATLALFTGKVAGLGLRRGTSVRSEEGRQDIAAEENVDAEFDAFLEEWFAEFMAQKPMDALSFGLRPQNCGGNSSTPVWGDVSAAAEARAVASDGHRLAEMERRFGATIGARDTSDERHVSYLVMQLKVEEMRQDHLHADLRLPFGPLGCRLGLMGCQVRVAGALRELEIKKEEDARCYISFMRGLPEFLAGHASRLQEAAKGSGVVPYRAALEGIIGDCDVMVQSDGSRTLGVPDPRDNSLFKIFSEKLQGATDITDLAKDSLLREAVAAVSDGVWPAYRTVREVVRTSLLGKAPDGHFGIASAYGDRGEDFYAYRVRLLGVNKDAAALHQHALKLVNKNAEKMQSFAADVGRISQGRQKDAPKLALPLALAVLKKTYYKDVYADSEEGRTAFLATMQTYIQAMWGQLAGRLGGGIQHFLASDVPTRGCEVKRIWSPGFPSLAQYRPGSLVDLKQPSTVAFNVANMSALPKAEMEALVYHEVVPGHHLQVTRALALQAVLPKFRRYFGDEAFAEGWAVYAEQELAPTMTQFSTASKVGLLNFRQLRAIRTVVDTGIHHLGWDRAKAEQFYQAHSIISPARAATAVDRHLAWPGQQLAYAVGFDRLLEVKAVALAAEGPGATDAEAHFHHAILAHGDLPLVMLERVVLSDLAARQRNAH